MEYHDYVILFDENGQPYIAHSFKSRVSSGWGKVKGAGKRVYSAARTAGSKAHKYMLKIGEGAKAQYAYTKEEVDRLLGRGRRAASKAMAGAKSAAGKASSGIKSGAAAVKRAGIKAADKFGVDDYIRLKKSYDHYIDAPRGSDEEKQWDKRFEENRDAYLKTPLGKLHKGAADFYKRAYDFSDELNDKLYTKTYLAGKDAKRYGDIALNAIKSAPGKIADKLGFDERQRLKEAEEAAKDDKYNPRRFHERAAARAEYESTALGKAEGAARKAGAAAKAAAGKVRDYAKETAEDIAENAAERRATRRVVKSTKERSKIEKKSNKSGVTAGQTRADSKTTKAAMNYNNALKEYNKVKYTGGEDEASAYWALVAAEREYERITGQKPPKRK